MREYSKSRVEVRDLEVHDTVVLAGPEVTATAGVFSLDFMHEPGPLSGEVLEALEGFKPGTIRMRVETAKSAYLIEVERSQEFLKISPNITTAGQIKAGDKIIMRGEAAPEELGGKPAHTELVLGRGAVSTVLKTWTLRDGCIRLTVLLGRKKRFKFVVEPARVMEIF